MEELIKNIKQMGMSWFLESLRSWEDGNINLDSNTIDEVMGDLNEYLEEEIRAGGE